MEEFALIKSRVNLNRVNLGIALISDLKVSFERRSIIIEKQYRFTNITLGLSFMYFS